MSIPRRPLPSAVAVDLPALLLGEWRIRVAYLDDLPGDTTRKRRYI